MHYSISIISEGKSRQEAYENALGCADGLVEQNEFDYHADEGETHHITSAVGQKAIEGALRATREDFMRALQVVRLMLREFTDEQIYQEDFGDDDPEHPQHPRDYYASRWQFAQVGTTRSYLYATEGIWGAAITNDKDYERALEDRDTNDLWVTTMDFHN